MLAPGAQRSGWGSFPGRELRRDEGASMGQRLRMWALGVRLLVRESRPAMFWMCPTRKGLIAEHGVCSLSCTPRDMHVFLSSIWLPSPELELCHLKTSKRIKYAKLPFYALFSSTTFSEPEVRCPYDPSPTKAAWSVH